MILRKTGRDVYKSIREKLAKGDASELIEHLNWFFYREKGKYNISVSQDEIVFEVLECPAIRHLKKLGLTPSKHISVFRKIWKLFLNNQIPKYLEENSDKRKVIDFIAGMTDDMFLTQIKLHLRETN
jgi:dGTP triphosphohydrolase